MKFIPHWGMERKTLIMSEWEKVYRRHLKYRTDYVNSHNNHEAEIFRSIFMSEQELIKMDFITPSCSALKIVKIPDGAEQAFECFEKILSVATNDIHKYVNSFRRDILKLCVNKEFFPDKISMGLMGEMRYVDRANLEFMLYEFNELNAETAVQYIRCIEWLWREIYI